MSGRYLTLSAALAIAACAPRQVDYAVNIVTSSCESSSPLEKVTSLKVRVTGEGLNPPLEAIASISAADRQLVIPEIPAGKARVVEARAYADGNLLVSIGRSLPFDVPDTVPEGNAPVAINIFLRRVNEWTRPSKVNQTNACGGMLNGRAGHTATLLANGKVYIAGGYQAIGNNGHQRLAISKTEFFNPQTGGFEEGPDLGVINSSLAVTLLPKAFHTATRLLNGQVVVWGGESYAGNDLGVPAVPTTSVLVFDPDQNGYGAVPSPSLNVNATPQKAIARAHHRAALDKDGRLLIIGGYNNSNAGKPFVAIDQIEWFNPASLTSRSLATPFPRAEMSVSAVQGGAFIAVAGGTDGTVLKDDVAFFSYDPGGQTFTQASTNPLRLGTARRSAGIALFRDQADAVLVGGYKDAKAVNPLDTSEIVKTGSSFTVGGGPNISVGRGDICAATLADGKVLLIGGRTVDVPGSPPKSSDAVEIVIPQDSGVPVLLGRKALGVPRYHHTCTTLPDGSVLVLGGVKESNNQFEVLQDAMIYTPDPGE